MPRRQYYGGAPNPFAGGMAFGADRRFMEQERARAENAFQALIAQYGPEAGLPQEAATMQAVQQRGELHPHVVAEHRHRTAMHPHLLGAAERETAGMEAVAGEHGPVAGSPAAWGMQQNIQQQQQMVALAAAQGLLRAREQGGDLGAAFDRQAQFLQASGLPPDEIMTLRELVISDPSALDEWIAALQSAGMGAGTGRMLGQGEALMDPEGNIRFMQFGPGGQPHEPLPGWTPLSAIQAQQRIGQRDRALTNEEARMRGFQAIPGHQYYEDEDTKEIYARVIEGTAQEREIEQTKLARFDELQNFQFSWETGLNQNQAALRDINRAIEIAEKINRMPALARAAASRLPGDRNPYFQLRQSVESLKKNVGINTLLDIRRSGATLGQVPQNQLETLMDTRGMLRADRNPAFLVEDLRALQSEYHSLIRRIEGNLQEWGTEMDELREQLGRTGGRSTQPTGAAPAAPPGGAPPPGIAAPGTGPTWQQRAAELRRQNPNMSVAEIGEILRREGLRP